MRLLSPCLRALALASLSTATLLAQNPAAAPAPGPMRMPPITLGPDDVPAFPDAPAGFNAKRDGIPHGKLEMIEYDSKTVGTRRKMHVYTPPGYSTDEEVSRALSPARHRRRRDRVAALRAAGELCSTT